MPTRDTNITAKILCDYVNQHGDRWTAYQLTYPLCIHAELLTHRLFSRLSASSRAVPTKKKIEKVKTRPFIPSFIGLNKRGMQATEEADKETQENFKHQWLLGAAAICHIARSIDVMGIHKQIVNRLLYPWEYTTTLVAATNFGNFFKLRCHHDAEPHFQALAYHMLEAYVGSEPKFIEGTEWVGPFMDKMPPGCTEEERKKIAVARCARISYENFNGEINKEDDIRLHDSLWNNGHMSPFEFVVRPAPMPGMVVGNLHGWLQYRKTIPHESHEHIDYLKLLTQKPSWI